MRLHGTEYAGGNTDGMITFGEIGRYAREFYKGLSDDDPSNVQLENEPLLDRIIVGTRTFMPSMTSPDVPVDVTARSRDMYTLIDWSKTSNATSYWIYRYPVDDPSEWKWIGVAFDNRYEDKTADLNKRYGYRVMALNSLGKSELSYVAEGLRGTNLYLEYLSSLFGISEASVDDWNTMEMATSMNGYTYKECYALGIDPEDPNDDLKITDFKIEDGKPVITLNHTKDGSGNSFEPRIKTLGKANLTDVDWVDVTDKDKSAYRFFKVTVDLP